MSHCNKIQKLGRKVSGLAVLPKRMCFPISIRNNGTSLCACKRASYTLEAVVVFPLIAIFFVMILFLFRVIQVERDVQLALYETSRKMASGSLLGEGSMSDFVMAQYYFQKEIKESPYVEQYVKGKRGGIVILSSSEEREYLNLQANYQIEFPIGIGKWDSLWMTTGCKQHRWIGRQLTSGKEVNYVYITPEGEAYHLTSECNYLDLSIYRTEIEEIKYLHNRNDEKYNACSRCADKYLEFVYVTYYGRLYHGDLGCSSLKRTVQIVPISEVGNRKLCSKCGKNHEKTP